MIGGFTIRTHEFKLLDPLLHSQLRLAVMSCLFGMKESSFTEIREKTKATPGNLSIQINKLKKAGYITVSKKFKENYPQTMCCITAHGIQAFEQYIAALQSYVNLQHDQVRFTH